MKSERTVGDWVPVGFESASKAKSVLPISFKPMLSRGAGALKRVAMEVLQNPQDAGAFERLGVALAEAGQHQRATDMFGTAVVLDPAFSRAWSALGEAYLRVAGPDVPMPSAARNAFERAFALDPEDVRAQFYLAMDKEAHGARDEAIETWLGLLRTVPLGSRPNEAVRAAILASLKREMALD